MDDNTFDRQEIEKSRYMATTPLMVFIKIITVIWVIEGCIMLAFQQLPKMPELIEAFVDATTLSLLSTIPIWFWIIKPLKVFAGQYLSHLESLEKALNASAIVAVTDTKGLITHVNNKFVEISGYSKAELVGQDHRIINSGFHPKSFFKDLWTTISNGNIWKSEVKNKKKSGEFYWVDSTAVPMFNQNGKLAQYITIRYDITARKQLEEKLVAAKEDAEKANQTKTRFLANMSHEIRTPMNGIIGMSNLLMNSVKNPLDLEHLKVIQSCCNSLLDITNDVLDFSKLEAHKVELENHALSLRDTVDEVLKLLSTRATEKKIEITYHHGLEVPLWVQGDVTRIRQILMNLISNAIKFTEHGRIDVSSQVIKSENNKYIIQFAIKDTGIGIPENVRESLFQSFSQVDASTTRRFGGTGLGLAICKGLCEKMNGSIWVESEVGRGSTFFFTFEAQAAESLDIQNSLNPLPAFDPDMSKKHPLRILIAEDNRTNQLVAVGLLNKLGYRADVAANGKEAIECLERQNYDLLLMDCHMPEMDGFEATKLIVSKYSAFDRPKIVALTASSTKEDMDHCRESGMDGFLSKPITISQLVTALLDCKPLSKTFAA